MLLGNPHRLFGDREDVQKPETCHHFQKTTEKMWDFSASRFGEDRVTPVLHFLHWSRREVRARMLARTPRYGKLSLAWRCTRGTPLEQYAISGELLLPQEVEGCCD
jgi:hypothetical protein